MQTGTQAIDRAAALLVLVVENEESSSVGELAEAAGLPKSTVSRALSALERQGLVQRNGSRGTIRPGPVLLGLARRGVSDDDVVELCNDALQRLSEATGETIDLAVPVAGGAEQYLAQVDSRHFLGTTNWVGRRLPHHCTAVGKVLLAFGASRLTREPLERLTADTIIDRAVLLAQLDTVRSCGFATAVGELEPGLVAVAAPVLGADGRALAAISISGPALRMRPELLGQFGTLLTNETTQLSARLGYRPAKEGAA
jgi:IclR family transcriptional regulator, acetate operon repressor